MRAGQWRCQWGDCRQGRFARRGGRALLSGEGPHRGGLVEHSQLTKNDENEW